MALHFWGLPAYGLPISIPQLTALEAVTQGYYFSTPATYASAYATAVGTSTNTAFVTAAGTAAATPLAGAAAISDTLALLNASVVPLTAVAESASVASSAASLSSVPIASSAASLAPVVASSSVIPVVGAVVAVVAAVLAIAGTAYAISSSYAKSKELVDKTSNIENMVKKNKTRVGDVPEKVSLGIRDAGFQLPNDVFARSSIHSFSDSAVTRDLRNIFSKIQKQYQTHVVRPRGG